MICCRCVALVAFAVNTSFLYLGWGGLPPTNNILVSPLKMMLFMRFKTDSPFQQVFTPSTLCCYLSMNRLAEKKIQKTDSHFSGVDLFQTMLQFYFQMNVFSLFFCSPLHPCLSGGGETHYKMCRRREERENEWEEERVALWCSVSGLPCILLALFTQYAWAVNSCLHSAGLPKGEMFYYMLSLKSMTNCALFFSPALALHSSPSLLFSLHPCLGPVFPPSCLSTLSPSGLKSEALSVAVFWAMGMKRTMRFCASSAV